VAPGQRLADFGGPPNLLECVPTYVHQVAGFNAAAAWSSRLLSAAMHTRAGRAARAAASPASPAASSAASSASSASSAAASSAATATEAAAELRRRADALAAATLELSVGDGSGVWYAAQPNGAPRLVNRHVLDFAYVAEFLHADLPRPLREAMAAFARRELLVPEQGWMRAQSLSDPAARDSDRTDHGPWGAYAGWPPITAAALATLGHQRDGMVKVAVLVRPQLATSSSSGCVRRLGAALHTP